MKMNEWMHQFSQTIHETTYYQMRFQRELYETLSPGYKGRCTAPLLVDLKAKKIVSNESSDIVRMLNTVKLGRDESIDCIDLYSDELAAKIDETNEWVYDLLNNGVYRCGFSTQQNAYDQAC